MAPLKISGVNPLFICLKVLALFLFFIQAPLLAQSETLSLNDYLHRVSETSEEVRAVDLDIQSLRWEIEARDLELSPTVSAEYLRFWDSRPSSSSSRQTEGHSTEVILHKPLPTGTNLNLSSYLESAEYLNNTDEQNLLSWQFGVSQSLWQNSFGRQTSLRRQRDREELKSRLLTFLLERQELLMEFEQLYWDIAYTQQELKIREENLDRSRRILSWIEERVGRSAAESVDLLQGQTLVSSRELQLQLSADNLKTLEARLQGKLSDSEFTPTLDDLKANRDIMTLPASIDFAPSTPVLIDTLQAQAEANFLKATADLESDRLKPVIDIGYSYGQQGFSTSYSTARDQAFSRKNDYHQVGVVFSMPLDFFLVSKSRRAGKAAAEAQNMRAAKFQRQSPIAWEDLERTVEEKKKRVETARKLADLQMKKSEEERSRYEKGRTTVFQAITFEQEAAEGELLVVQLLNQLRQTEAQARIFVQGKRNEPDQVID